MDGDKVQTLWTYGAEDVHWSTKAESFTINAGTDKEKSYEYEDGQFHLKQSPNDPNSVWKKNAMDPALVICSLDNGFNDISSLAAEVTSSSPRTARMLLSLLPLRPTPTSPVPSMMLSWQLSLL